MINLPKDPRTKIIIGVIIILLISPLFFKAYKSLWAKNKKLMAEINKNTEELKKSAALYATQENLNSEIKRLNLQLSSVEEKIFRETEEAFVNINRFALESKVSLKSIEPLERTKVQIPGSKNQYLELLPLNLKVKCDFYQLLQFLNKIERAANVMPILDIKIQSDSKDIWNHDIQITLKIPILVSSRI